MRKPAGGPRPFSFRLRVPRLVWVVVGSVVLLAVLLIGVFPTRSYFEQREEIAREAKRLAVLDAENARLAARVEELQTDAEVERLAREQYNLVRPGEEAYAILPGPADARPDAPPAADLPAPVVLEGADPSWWARTADALTFWD